MSNYLEEEYQNKSIPSTPGGTTEKSIKSCYAVVYSLQNRKWVVSGEGGWSEVHLCCDSADNSYRILAWTVKSQQVLLNANCTGECMYKEKSQNFHSFADENGQRYGLGFHKSDSGLQQAEYFFAAVLSVIEGHKATNEIEGTSAEDSEENDNASKPTPVPVKRLSTQIVRTPPTPSLSEVNTQRQTISNSPRGTSTIPKRPPPPPAHASSRTVVGPPNERDNNKGSANANTSANINGPSNSSSSGTNAFNSSKRYSGHSGGLPPPIKTNKVGALPPLPDTTKTNHYSNSPLPPLSKATSLNRAQGNGLPDPSSDENNEEKSKPTFAVKAAVNGFDFEIKKKMSMADLHQPDYHLNSHQIKSVPKGTPKLGKLPVLAPKPQKFKEQDDKISDVTFVERTVQVTYDKDEGVFRGLPKEWEELLNKQFGVSPKHIPGIKLPQYAAKIPKVLVILKEKLVEANGYQQVGIFRLAPDVRDNNAIKSSIDSGKFEMDAQHADVNVYANLIKVWFRDLPDPLLNCVAPERVEMASKESDVIKIISDFPEPHKSIFLWLCDMCVECAIHEDVNKMGPKNLAIVIGPNLFNTTKFENPMKAMTYSAKVVEFFEKAIKWRQATTDKAI